MSVLRMTIALLAMFATPAIAYDVHHWLPKNIERPPVKYRGEPSIKVKVKHVHQRDLKDKCPSRHQIVACYRPPGLYGATMYIVNGLRAETEAAVLEHERGHVNGWVH